MGSRSCNASVVETYPYRIAPVMRKYMTVFLGDTPLCHLVGFEDDYVLLRYVRKKQRFLATQEILVAAVAPPRHGAFRRLVLDSMR